MAPVRHRPLTRMGATAVWRAVTKLIRMQQQHPIPHVQAPVLVRRKRKSGRWLVILAFFFMAAITGCDESGLPPPPASPPGMTKFKPGGTHLGRLVAKLNASHPGESAFHLLDNGEEAYKVDFRVLPQSMEGPATVLAAAPAQECLCHVSPCFRVSAAPGRPAGKGRYFSDITART